MASVDDYAKLITSQHRDKPKYMAMITATLQPIVDNINTLAALDFDIDTAIGDQLDIIGRWVGLGRQVPVPLSIYFSFNTAGLGFNQGVWKGPFSPPSGLVSLDDATYRRLLYAKIGINTWDGTIRQLNAIMVLAFEGSGATVIGIDNLDKSITIQVSGTLPLILKSLLDTGIIIPKSVGISINLVYL